MNFTHLHVHTEYSLLDGACRIDKLMPYLKEIGQSSVAITDHGVMYGIIDFYKAARKHGIKPIIGCEVYVSKRGRLDKIAEYDRENYHLILLCKDNEGYQNLIKLCSLGFTEGFYGKPRIDHELLEKYCGGLIALSACLAGEIPRNLMNSDYDKAKEIALFYNSVFGKDNFYLELQNHGIKEQLEINPQIIRLSKETGIPLVATNDAHYIKRQDNLMQKTLLCIQLNQTVDEDTGMEFATDDFYIKTAEEMYELFGHVEGACENTNIIAEKCNVEFEFGVTKLPHFALPDGADNAVYFEKQCLKGLKNKYGENATESVYKRLEYEISVIKKMGYIDYFLIVSDFVNFAKAEGIPVGPGRGSGAGSLCAYCIGITGIDPMKYNLLFERFLNPDRVTMPDFDIDFCYVRRQEVIDYCIKKYGADHVAQIVTFGTMAARSAIRDVGRATGVPYSVCDTTAKLVPFAIHMDLETAMQQSNDLKSLYDNDTQIHELLDMAQAVEGMPRHASTHAAGVVITREPVNHYVPLAKNDEAIVTQLPMTTLEELGLLKMDFLGLRTLTVLSDTIKMLAKSNILLDLESIDLTDNNIYKLLSAGQTEGVFQYESAGMKSVLMRLKPENFEDLIAVISLYRPGPMDSIPKYIFGRHNPDKIKMSTPKLQNILSVTYGCIVYQEQVMQIFRELAGYSYGHADIVRRAISKKKKDVLEQERQNFVDGAAKNGIDTSTATNIFNDITAFASYAFNKSHAAAYALISYQTAYLKHYYVKEFMAALLSSVLDSTYKVTEYINECDNLNIKVLQPSVNNSFMGFIVDGDNIRFGLLAVKNIGYSLIERIVENREQNGRYKSLYDFCIRCAGRDLNKRSLECLVLSGSLDDLGLNRRQMLQCVDLILKTTDSEKKRAQSNQLDLFSTGDSNTAYEFEYPDVQEMPKQELLKLEKEVIGLYLTGHPMQEQKEHYKLINPTTIKDILVASSEVGGLKDNSQIKIMGIISSFKTKITKNNKNMAFVTVEDLYGAVEVLIFPTILEQSALLLRMDAVIVIEGKLSLREDKEPTILANAVYTLEEALQKLSTKNNDITLYLRLPDLTGDKFNIVTDILSKYKGTDKVVFCTTTDNKKLLAPKNMWVNNNELLRKSLIELLGESNVAYK